MTRGAKTILTSAVSLALLAGTASGANPDPKQMVLRLQDMPTGFEAAGSGYKSVTAAANGSTVSVAQYKAWGYVTAYEAHFRQNGNLGDLFSGVSQVTSLVSVYRTSGGAKKSLASSAATCAKSPFQELSVGAKIGDEAHLCARSVPAQVYAVLWRRGRLKAAILIAGVAGTTSPKQAVALAETQDKRMG